MESSVAGLEAERTILEKIRDDQAASLSAEREEKTRIMNELSKYKAENTTEELLEKGSEENDMKALKYE